jgi:hypothetical protein
MKIALAIFAVLCNVTMDHIQYHWDMLFAHWFPAGKDQWWNPAISWKNKYKKSYFWTKVFSTLLVFTTDFWHLLKFLFLNSIFLIIALMSDPGIEWWKYILVLVFLNVCWGILFEIFNIVYGWFSEKYDK